MKTRILKYLLAILIICCSTYSVKAQRYITNSIGYACYNYFDSNTVDNTNNNNPSGVYAPGFLPDPNVATNNTSVIVSGAATNNLAAASGRCLQSKYQATPKGLAVNYIPNAADASFKTSLNNNDWEWSLIYNCNLGFFRPSTPSTTIGSNLTAGSNSWRYWLSASSSTFSTSMDGFYLTQDASGFLRVYVVKSGTAYQLLVSNSALNNGTSYCIKIQRNAGGYWKMYLDPLTTTVTQAQTLQTSRTNASDGQAVSLTYGSSYLEAENSFGSDGAFQFDEMHMYTRYLKYSGITSTANGITPSPLYAGMGTAILYGMQIQSRGNYEMGSQIYFTSTGTNSAQGNFTGNASLYRTTNSVFAVSGSTLINNALSLYDTGTQNTFSFSDTYVSAGNTDGSATNLGYYFITATLNSSVNTSSTLTYNGFSSIYEVKASGNSSAATIVNSPGTTAAITFASPTTATVTTTTPVTNIYGGTGTVGGSITSTGGSTVTEYGVVYSTSATTPTTANSKFIMGSGATTATTFSAPLQGLAPNTTYYVRAYAINSLGTSYGAATSFTTLAAPNIAYVTPQTYTVNTAITPLSPTNTGGAVPATTYLATSNFVTSGLSQPFNLDFDAAGNLYEVDNTTGNILKISPAGVVTTFATGLAAGTLTGIAVDPSGYVYVGSVSNVIYKITPAGVVSNYISSASLNSPYGPILDNAGNLYFASFTTGNIYEIPYGTTTLTLVGSGFNGPWGLAFDPAGNLYVSERTGGGLYKIINSTTKTLIASFGSLSGVVIDAAGDIFVADYGLGIAGNGAVREIPAGSSTPVAILTGLNSTRGLALDPTGQSLYIADSGNNKIIKEILTGYTYTGTLPAGLSFDYTTGTVSGTPTAVTSATGNTITVTGYNSAGNSVTTLTIIVNPTAPTVAGTTTLCGAQTTSLTASGGLPSGGTYNWYTVATGGTAVASTATYTPFMGGTTTLYVSYTSGASISARTPVTVTVNQKFSSSINTPMLSYPFESGSLTDWSGLANTGTLQGNTLPVATADRNGITNGAYQFSGTNASPQYISTTTQYDPLVYSYSIWFKTTTAGGKLIGIGGAQTGSNATQDRNLYIGSTGQLFYGVYNGGTVSINTTTTYIDGLWHHAVVTDGPTYGMRIYVDGTLQASTATYTIPQQINEYWRIGGDNLAGWPSRPTNDYFVGTLDDVAIYNHELTPTEAASNDMNLYSFSSAYCANNPLTVTAQTIPGATYSWVDNATPSITGTNNPVTFSNATATNYTLTTTVNGCTQSTAIVTPAIQTYTWTGANSSTNTASNLNWTNTSTGIVGTAGSGAPTFNGTENIIIPGGLSFYPALTGTTKIYTLTINSGGSLNLNGNTLTVGCNIFNSSGGQILYSSNNSSGINWAGSVSNQSFTGSTTASTTQVGTMTIANTNATPGTITVNSGSLDVYYALNMTTGNLAVTSPATLTLKSSSTQSAAVGIIPTACSITGIVNVERFITGGGTNNNRGYRMVSSPVNQTSPTSALTNTFGLTYLKDHTFNGIAYTGVYTGGTAGTSAGFSTTSVGPTITIFDERKVSNNKAYSAGKNIGVTKVTPTNGVFTPATTNTIDLTDGTTGLSLPVGNSFQMFFIGPSSRTNTLASVAPQDAVLTAHGYLNQKNVTVALWHTPTGGVSGNLSYTSSLGTTNAGYNMVGNPYASTINLQTVLNDNSASIDNIYVLSARAYPYQSFIAYTPNGTSGPSTGYAVSGEGFFVHAIGTGKTLTFNENEKAPTTQLTGGALIMSAPKGETITANGGVASGNFKTMLTLQNTQSTNNALTGFYMKMEHDTINYNYCGIYFGDQWSAKFQQGDAKDINTGAGYVSMSSLSSDGVISAVKHFPDYKNGSRIKLYADGQKDGMYTLSIEGIRNIDTNNYKINLLDHFKNDSLDIGRYKKYAFNILKSDTNTFGGKRFELAIEPLAASAKYKLASLNAQKANDGILVTWRTLNEGNNYSFTLEKQLANGTDYVPVYNLQSNGGTNYAYTDKTPFKGNNVYRLKQVDLFGNITYAGPVSVYYDQSGTSDLFVVYPNPTAETLHVNVTFGKTNNTAATYKLNIYDVTGSLVMQKTSVNTTWSENVSKFNPGIYIVELKDNNGSSLGKAKFVKK
ncbi:LamG-like jellyroll fold domain-containing protein [Mucilaginibacter flavus]|uniref:LamG-like jellyroll fold domain-containing protein n=1 Tax=Mucilaginibacter flavus TaxID=931504 RepID=UPI0025B3C9DF|nr:LamG-like jellyroll fold domain-containing protein [Mucilaginibacter flavus]MDN3580273.1 T9SS type A sorting domain-containing protein [Mucilaginibacter flavus]